MDKTKSNYRKFLLLWSGELISSIGGGLSSFGLGIYIYQKTGSAAGMAFMTLLAFLPALILRVPAGVLADKYDRRLLMMIGDGCSGLGVLFILICMLTGEAQIWQIYVGVTISSVFTALLSLRSQLPSQTFSPRNSTLKPTASYPLQGPQDISSLPSSQASCSQYQTSSFFS